MNTTYDDNLVYVGGCHYPLTPPIVKSPLPPFAKGGIEGGFSSAQVNN